MIITRRQALGIVLGSAIAAAGSARGATPVGRSTPTDLVLLKQKLASHRARGLGSRENSLAAIKKAFQLPIPYVEMDTRVSLDGVIFLLHDPCFPSSNGRNLCLAKTAAEEIRRSEWLAEPITELDTALTVFSDNSAAPQKLCIDVKDLGFESTYLALLKKHNLEDRIIFLSAIPKCLRSLRDLGFLGPLILTQWNLAAFGLAGRMLSKAIKSMNINFGDRVWFGSAHIESDLKPYQHGYEHKLVSADLPASLISLLSKSRGGLCAPKSLYGEQLAKFCADAGLKLWLYSADTADEFRHLAGNASVDVVLCNDASGVIAVL
jgi:glycerophosphoryl diester phosphodiesterase